MSALNQEQREKEDATRVTRQRPVLRVCAELALVGIIKDAPARSGGEWIMKIIRELVCLPYMSTLSSTTINIAFQRSDAVLSTSPINIPQIVLSPLPRDPISYSIF